MATQDTLSKVWTAPTRDVLHNLEMFASTQDLEFVQGQSRDVPDRELGPNIFTDWRAMGCRLRSVTQLLIPISIKLLIRGK